jgi:hypothetical protein
MGRNEDEAMPADDPQLHAWIERQLAKAPPLGDDPERCRRIARLLRLGE